MGYRTVIRTKVETHQIPELVLEGEPEELPAVLDTGFFCVGEDVTDEVLDDGGDW